MLQRKKKESSYPITFSFHKAQMHPDIRSCEMGLYPFLFVLPCIPCNQTISMTNTEEELEEEKPVKEAGKKAFIEGRGNSGKSSILEANISKGFKEY